MRPMRPDTPDKRVKRELEKLKRQVAEERSGARKTGRTTFSKEQLTVNKGADISVEDGGALRVSGGGGVRIESEGDIDFEKGGRFIARYESGREMVMVGTTSIGADSDGLWVLADEGSLVPDEPGFPPRQILVASQAAESSQSGAAGDAWLYANPHKLSLLADGDALVRGTSLHLSTTSNEIGLYGLPSGSGSANLAIGTVGGKWTVHQVSSSRRYKQDITDLHVDPEAVLRWRPRTWRDKSDVTAVGDDAAWHIGYVAEEIYDAGSPQFVNYDTEGRIDGLDYDRMTIGLQALAVRQEERITTLESELTEARAENAALRERLDALEIRLDQIEEA